MVKYIYEDYISNCFYIYSLPLENESYVAKYDTNIKCSPFTIYNNILHCSIGEHTLLDILEILIELGFTKTDIVEEVLEKVNEVKKND